MHVPCPCPPSAGTSQSLTGSHRRRGVNNVPRQEPPAQHARLGEECIHVMIVRADVDKPIGYCGRGLNNAPRGEAPDLRSGAGIERVHVAVARADVDDAMGYRGRGLNGTPRGEAPDLAAIGCLDRIHVVICRADVDDAVDHTGRGVNNAPCLASPTDQAIAGIERINDVVFRADVGRAPSTLLGLRIPLDCVGREVRSHLAACRLRGVVLHAHAERDRPHQEQQDQQRATADERMRPSEMTHGPPFQTKLLTCVAVLPAQETDVNGHRVHGAWEKG